MVLSELMMRFSRALADLAVMDDEIEFSQTLADVAVVDEEVIAMKVGELILKLAIFSIPVIVIFIVILVVGKKKKSQSHIDMTSDTDATAGDDQAQTIEGNDTVEESAAEKTHEE